MDVGVGPCVVGVGVCVAAAACPAISSAFCCCGDIPVKGPGVASDDAISIVNPPPVPR